MSMLALIVLIVFGIGVAFFATQNTQQASIIFADYQFNAIPMYIIVLGAILFGILVSGIISLVNSISSGMKMHGKDSTIKEGKKETSVLTRRVRELELENEKLKGEKSTIARI